MDKRKVYNYCWRMEEKNKNRKFNGPRKFDRKFGGRPDRRRSEKPEATSYWLYGKHPVLMALNNPDRKINKIVCTKNAYNFLQENFPAEKLEKLTIDMLEPQKIDRLLGNRNDVTHQGLAAEVEPLKQYEPESFLKAKLIVATDKVTDPHNIGAILRSCAAFGAAALITQEKNSPPENATVAKTSAGGIELVPYVRVSSLWKTLEQFKQNGFKIIGLAGETDKNISDITKAEKTVLVTGSEGLGLSESVTAVCDEIARINIKPEIESLNASVATAVALYELKR